MKWSLSSGCMISGWKQPSALIMADRMAIGGALFGKPSK